MSEAPLHRVTTHRGHTTTWGTCWPRGAVAVDTPLALASGGGEHPLQSWPLATWPDGSLKWSGHAARVPDAAAVVRAGSPAAPDEPVWVDERGAGVVVGTGTHRWHVAGPGRALIARIDVDGRTVGENLRLVSVRQAAAADELGGVGREAWWGGVESLAVEQSGPVRVVVRLTGRHRPIGPTSREWAWLPFTVRLAFSAGEPDVRIQHSFVWDGDPDADFLAGLGARVDVPLPDEPWNRHVRLGGPVQPDGTVGFLAESPLGITGLRRDPGADRRAAQVAGRRLDPTSAWPDAVASRLHWVPRWDDWNLEQHSPDGFTLAKRTGPAHAWVPIPGGTRATGFAYAGGASGGVAIGQRDFWQTFPSAVHVRGMAGDRASLTSWLWSPGAQAMDLRFYHDGLGATAWPDQLDAMEITYEDHEPTFGDAHGIARTHELRVFAYPATPDPARLSADAAATQDPLVVMPTPAHLRACGVLGDWVPLDDDPAAAPFEVLLDELAAFYSGQVEDRRWYGFWDHGDVMHAYDPDRHQWRYDVGGFAWDNSELSPDLWLWTQVLRTGHADVFRLAEAMSRHTGEVDVHHLGRFAGLGSRHNVQHWGCSAKQLRISSAAYRRVHHYLTADERVGDLLDELVEAETTFARLDPTRKVRSDGYVVDPHAVSIGLGTDWGALAAAWLTAWERHGDAPAGRSARDKLLGTMADIGALPRGFLTGEARMDLDTGRFDTRPDQESVSHLSAMFGLVEICSELVSLTDGTPQEQPGFARAWEDYCRFYTTAPGHRGLTQAHSRLGAWAAARSGDAALARLAWQQFLDPDDPIPHDVLRPGRPLEVRWVGGPGVLKPVREASGLSTNGAAQFSLAAIQNLALIRDALPEQG